MNLQDNSELVCYLSNEDVKGGGLREDLRGRGRGHRKGGSVLYMCCQLVPFQVYLLRCMMSVLGREHTERVLTASRISPHWGQYHGLSLPSNSLATESSVL